MKKMLDITFNYSYIQYEDEEEEEELKKVKK